MSDPLDLLQTRLGYTFRAHALLELAFTHTSSAAERMMTENNERLEFLGDAVLQILIAEAVYRLFPNDREGMLTTRRALLVNQHFLARLARDNGLNTCLRLGKSEEITGGRERSSLLSDVFEAFVGALYLDSDLETTRRIVLSIYGDLSAYVLTTEIDDNPKGRLQELVQPQHGNHALRYEVTGVEGEDHARVYEVEVFLHERALGKGRGPSKKVAEEAAARIALITLKAEAPA